VFPRVLLDDAATYLAIDWFGLGKLRAIDLEAGIEAAASPALKRYFMLTMEQVADFGIPLDPDSPTTRFCLRYFAGVLCSQGVQMELARMALPPRHLAAFLVEKFKRQNDS
jgi:hypothetical protein